MMAVLLDMPLGILLPAETQQRLRTQFVHSPQHARCPDDARAVLETLHSDPRGVERRPDGHGPMVRQQPCLVPRQVRLEPVPQLRRPWRPIGDQGYVPALNDKLRQDQYMQVLPRDRQTGRHGGVGVHDGADVGPAVQDSEVQVQFTRRVAAPPVRARPANGVLRLFEQKAAGSTVQRAVTSSTTTSAGTPGLSVPPGSRKAAAGAVLIRWTSSGSASNPPATSSVYATANAVSNPTIPKGASSKAASLAS